MNEGKEQSMPILKMLKIITMYNKISILELEWQLKFYSSERFKEKITGMRHDCFYRDSDTRY